MPTTSRQSLRYPVQSDPPAGFTQIQNLATDVDGKAAWRGVGSTYPGSIAVGDTFYHTTLKCTMRALTTGGSWKQQDIVFVADAGERASWLASVTASGIALHEGFQVWQVDNDLLWASNGTNTLEPIGGDDTGASAATLASGWTGGCGYRVRNGVLYVHVFAERASWTGGQVVATLPAGARPSFSTTFIGSVNFGATIYELRLNTDGTVVVNTDGSGGVFATTSWPL